MTLFNSLDPVALIPVSCISTYEGYRTANAAAKLYLDREDKSGCLTGSTSGCALTTSGIVGAFTAYDYDANLKATEAYIQSLSMDELKEMQTLLLDINSDPVVEEALSKSYKQLENGEQEDFELIQQSISCLESSVQTLTVGEFNEFNERGIQKVLSNREETVY